MVRCVLAVAALLALAGACTSPSDSPSKERKATGSPTDPVDVCERVGDVCRLSESQLGVCIAPPAGSKPDACAGRDPCFICTSQH
jgi:hypothetical protein